VVAVPVLAAPVDLAGYTEREVAKGQPRVKRYPGATAPVEAVCRPLGEGLSVNRRSASYKALRASYSSSLLFLPSPCSSSCTVEA